MCRRKSGLFVQNPRQQGALFGSGVIQNVMRAHLHVIPRFEQEPYAARGIRHWLKQEPNRWRWNDPTLLEQLVSSSAKVWLRDGETTKQDLRIVGSGGAGQLIVQILYVHQRNRISLPNGITSHQRAVLPSLPRYDTAEHATQPIGLLPHL